jgi:hypothetical protein
MRLLPRMPAPEAEAFSERRHKWESRKDGITYHKLGLGSDKL